QQGLHIPASIDDQIEIDARLDHAINQSIRTKGYLSVVSDAEGNEFLRKRPALGKRREVVDSSLDPVEHMVGCAQRVVLSDVVEDFRDIALSVLGQYRLVPLHQTSAFLWRRRLMAVAAGVTWPASIWRLPSARIFRRAMVSCVSSYDAMS